MRWILVVIGIAVVAILAVVLLTSGESESDKAMAQICDSRDSISKQVDTLKGLTISDANTGKIGDSLQTIRTDLSSIADARVKLAGENRDQVDQANQQFAAALRGAVATIGTSSLTDTRDQVTGAFRTLAATYRDSYGKVDCS
jgi:hypothetical protein